MGYCTESFIITITPEHQQHHPTAAADDQSMPPVVTAASVPDTIMAAISNTGAYLCHLYKCNIYKDLSPSHKIEGRSLSVVRNTLTIVELLLAVYCLFIVSLHWVGYYLTQRRYNTSFVVLCYGLTSAENRCKLRINPIDKRKWLQISCISIQEGLVNLKFLRISLSFTLEIA